MYEAACRKEDTLAVHGMQRMERRKSVPSRIRASAMHVLPRLRHVRKHQGVFRLWPPEGGARLFKGCVAANAARSKAMSGMRLQSAGLLDLQPMPNAKEKRGLPAMEHEVQEATCTTGLRPMLGAEVAAECCGEGTRPCQKIATEKRDKVVAEVMALIIRKRKEAEAGTQASQGSAAEMGHGKEAVRWVEPQQRNKKGRHGERLFHYRCPFCEETARSATATGRVDHRSVCGKQFRVKDGQVACKDFRYKCPFCESDVVSSVRTGNIDHRRACGKQFYVRDGVISTGTRQYNYKCPFCESNVTSSMQTGRVDHRHECGNQFYVKDGVVSARTRQCRHKCPACRTTVWSSRQLGRIQVKHTTPSGWPCAQHAWTVK